MDEVGLTNLVTIITAVGALGTAAFGLVDATKALWGGPSNVGLIELYRVVDRFSIALDHVVGEGNRRKLVRAHWINGRPRDEQKATIKSLIRLGLTAASVEQIASEAHVDVAPAELRAAAEKLATGSELTETDLNILGRLDASIDAQLDAAFDLADQQYRSFARALAGTFAVILALFATWALGLDDWALAFGAGLLAVPLAPIAKDLASSLQAAAAVMKQAK